LRTSNETEIGHARMSHFADHEVLREQSRRARPVSHLCPQDIYDQNGPKLIPIIPIMFPRDQTKYDFVCLYTSFRELQTVKSLK
jgi:hypothetical protein